MPNLEIGQSVCSYSQQYKNISCWEFLIQIGGWIMSVNAIINSGVILRSYYQKKTKQQYKNISSGEFVT